MYAWNVEHNAAKLEEMLNRIMQKIMSITTYLSPSQYIEYNNYMYVIICIMLQFFGQ